MVMVGVSEQGGQIVGDSVIVCLRRERGVVVSPFQGSGCIPSTTLSPIVAPHTGQVSKRRWREDALKSDQSSFLSLYPRGLDP